MHDTTNPSPFVSRLILKNFSSISRGSLDLADITFLVGRNGSGKSNIVEALTFLAETAENPLQSVFNRRGGPDSVARRNPLRPHAYVDPEQTFGVGVVLGSLPFRGHWANAKRVVSARYSFEIAVRRRLGFRVIREQCIVKNEDGTRAWFDRANETIRSNMEFLNRPRAHSSLLKPWLCLLSGHFQISYL
jgi:predicted ATPase